MTSGKQDKPMQCVIKITLSLKEALFIKNLYKYNTYANSFVHNTKNFKLYVLLGTRYLTSNLNEALPMPTLLF